MEEMSVPLVANDEPPEGVEAADGALDAPASLDLFASHQSTAGAIIARCGRHLKGKCHNPARARDRLVGRPKAMDDKEAAMVRSMHRYDELSVKEVGTTLGSCQTTLYRYLQAKAS